MIYFGGSLPLDPKYPQPLNDCPMFLSCHAKMTRLPRNRDYTYAECIPLANRRYITRYRKRWEDAMYGARIAFQLIEQSKTEQRKATRAKTETRPKKQKEEIPAVSQFAKGLKILDLEKEGKKQLQTALVEQKRMKDGYVWRTEEEARAKRREAPQETENQRPLNFLHHLLVVSAVLGMIYTLNFRSYMSQRLDEAKRYIYEQRSATSLLAINLSHCKNQLVICNGHRRAQEDRGSFSSEYWRARTWNPEEESNQAELLRTVVDGGTFLSKGD
jgi:hypothetical protein